MQSLSDTSMELMGHVQEHLLTMASAVTCTFPIFFQDGVLVAGMAKITHYQSGASAAAVLFYNLDWAALCCKTGQQSCPASY